MKLKLKVERPFTDKHDHTTGYVVGDVLTIDDVSRANDLSARGLCSILAVEECDAKPEPEPEPEQEQEQEQEQPAVVIFQEKEYPVEQVKEALAAIGIPVTATAKKKGVGKVLDMLSVEQVTALMEALAKEE